MIEASSSNPVPGGLQRAWRVLHAGTVGAVRDLVWPDLRDGVIRVRDLRPAHTALVVLASALLVGGIGVLLMSSTVRASFDLVPSTRGALGRGSLVPAPLVPATLLLLAFSSGLVLAGALHVARWARLAVLAAYSCFALAAQFMAFSGLSDSTTKSWAALASVAAVGAVFAVRWRAEPRPVPEALVMVALASLNLALVQQELVAIDRVSGEAFVVDQTATLMFLLSGIATPLLLVAGLDVVEFGATASGWVLRFLDDKVHRRAVVGLLVALLAWRARDLVADLASSLGDDRAATLRSHAGALLLVAVVGCVWLAVQRLAQRHAEDAVDPDVTTAARKAGLPLALAYQAISLVLLFLVLAVEVVGRFDTGSRLDLFEEVATFVGDVNRGSWLLWWRWAVGAGAVAVGMVLARRGRRAAALVLGVIGAADLLGQATSRGGWLDSLLWDDAAVDHVWLVVVIVLALTWAVRGELDAVRAERLFFVALLAALIRQSAFISDPFALFLGFAGVGFVAFGLLWGFLTAGSWANEDTPHFPRSGRVFLFLGYSLFSITLLCWFVLAHDIDRVRSISEETPTFGQYLLGYPMLYALFAVTIAGAVARRPIEVGT